MFEAVSLDQRLQPRILGQVGGERLLTDLRHIAQVMHEAALEGQLGLTALLVWLRRRREEAAGEGGQERSRRLETDADAVQVITVHTSKGLEFPVVLVPFAWDNWKRDDPADRGLPRRARPPGARRRRPGQPRLGRARRGAQAGGDRRRAAADLRRADPRAVAPAASGGRRRTTRRPRRCTGCCCTTTRDRRAAAGQGARRRDGAGGLPRAGRPQRRRAGGRGGAGPAAGGVVAGRPAGAGAVSSPPSTRPLDTGWRRTSYSALTSAAHEQRLGSEPEVAQKDDEADLEEVPADVDRCSTSGCATSCRLWDAHPRRRGVRHAGALRARAASTTRPTTTRCATVVSAQVARCAPDLDADAADAARCSAALRHPARAAGRRGRAAPTSPAADRLPELDFELPLAGGDDALDRAGAARRTWCRCGGRRCRPGCCRRTPTRWPSCPTCRCAATSPAASTPCCGSATGRAALPRRRLQDQPARRLRRAADRLALPAGGAGDRDGRGALPAAGAALRRSRCTATCGGGSRATTPTRTSAACSTCSCAGCPGRASSDADGAAPGVFSWRPPAGLVVGTSDLLAGLR